MHLSSVLDFNLVRKDLRVHVLVRCSSLVITWVDIWHRWTFRDDQWWNINRLNLWRIKIDNLAPHRCSLHVINATLLMYGAPLSEHHNHISNVPLFTLRVLKIRHNFIRLVVTQEKSNKNIKRKNSCAEQLKARNRETTTWRSLVRKK